MIDEGFLPLRLGADSVQRLLPHRRPFLFVDDVLAIRTGDRPALRARKFVSANEAVFEGHFAELSLWPGVYTLEGMGQTANLLLVVAGIAAALSKEGLDELGALALLRELDGVLRSPTRRAPEAVQRLASLLGPASSRMGFAGAYDVKLIEPVLAGAILEYQVELTHAVGSGRRFAVQTTVAGRLVARGTMTSAIP